MRIFWIQLHKELREQWVTKRLMIVLVVMIGFGLLSPITAKLMPDLIASLGEQENITIVIGEVTANDAIDQFIQNVTQMVMLLVILMSFSTVVHERENNTMALILTHPIPREVFVLAKFAALAILFALGVAVSAATAFFYTAVLFDAPDIGGFLALVGLLYVYLMVFMALSVLASTVGRSTAGAVALAFGLVVVVLVAGIFTTLAPGELPGWGRGIATGIGSPDRFGALIAALVIIAASMAASVLALRRQEI